MKIKPWPWVSFFVHHHAHLWTIVVESKVSAHQIVGAQFGLSHQEFKYMQHDQFSAHDKFRHCIRLMATKIGEEPEAAVRRYMALPVEVTEP